MTQYLLAVVFGQDGPQMTEEQMQQSSKDVDALNVEMGKAGARVFAGGLEPPDAATVVRSSNGQIVTTDGPFAEAKEQIGGFWILEAPDLDVALEWAGKATVACAAPVEVRPFQAN